MAADDAQKRESVEEVDEAKKAAFNGDDYVANPELERSITRKCDLHILPWIFIRAYLCYREGTAP